LRSISEIVGFRGAYETLRALEGSQRVVHGVDDVLKLMEECGTERPNACLEDLVAANILHRSGDNFALTTFGIRTSLLLGAVNGGDVRETYRRLGAIDSTLRMYELIRQGMTKSFLRSLRDRPAFGRAYFCSPWISLDEKQAQMLATAILRVEKRRGSSPEILVITRPEEKTGQAPASLKPFRDIGATIFLNKRLHTKLYIREPDTSGGVSMAIVGSQNLTKSSYIELGIRINSDVQMINQLIAYFLELTFQSEELLEEEGWTKRT
jgi:hypothetical protein